MNKIIKVEHPYWGTCTARYDEVGEYVAIENTMGFAQRFATGTVPDEDTIIQLLDSVEEESRQHQLKQLLQGTLTEYSNKVYQNDTKGSEALLAKAQLANQIIDLLDLEL